MAIIRVRPGVAVASDGSYPEMRGTRKGAIAVQAVGNRFEELVLRGNVYAAQVANVATTTGTTALSAGGTPILLVWNPANSGRLLSILQAFVAVRNNGNPGPGSFVWSGGATAAITANTVAPINLLTYTKSGASGLFVANAAATSSSLLNYIRPIMGIGANTVVTAAGFPQGYEEIAGSLFVPPGNALAITSTVTAGGTSACALDAGIVWEELLYTA
jgi:hypothetical protein